MKQNRKLTKVLLMVYLLALTWIILFKLQMDFSNLRDMNYRSVNLSLVNYIVWLSLNFMKKNYTKSKSHILIKWRQKMIIEIW